MSLARSRNAVEMMRLTRLMTVGSLAITSMSCRFLPSAVTRPVRIEVLDHLLDRHLVALGDFFQQLRRRRRLLMHLQPAQQPDVIHHPLVARLGRGHVDRSVLDPQRQHAMAFDKISRQRAQRLRGNTQLSPVPGALRGRAARALL